MTESPRPKTHSGAVSQRILVDLIGAETSCVLAAQLRYDVDDPYAVTMVFASDEVEVRWTFGRDLLLDGLDQPSGEGDVHLRPCLDSDGHAVVLMELHSLGAEALVQVRFLRHPLVRPPHPLAGAPRHRVAAPEHRRRGLRPAPQRPEQLTTAREHSVYSPRTVGFSRLRV
jgi:hypothetical protein